MSLPIVAAAALVLVAAPVSAANWQVDHDNSRLGFVATQFGSEFGGQFAEFQADIDFFADDLPASTVSVIIQVASFGTGDGNRDGTAMGADWFDVEQFPEAAFAATTFRQVSDNAYEAVGQLTMKGVTRDVVLPFTLDITDGAAVMSGALTVDRADYTIGTGQWAGSEPVGREVTITIDLAATRLD